MDQPAVRLGWFARWVRETSLAEVATHLEELLAEDEGFSAQTAPALVTIVCWTSGGLDPKQLRRLATHAQRARLFHLARLFAHADQCPEELSLDSSEGRIPDYGRARPLTLGERKSLARRPARRDIDRLLRDPHPAVIEQLLLNPQLTETDVMKMATSRSINNTSACYILRSSRWITANRVRLGLLNNPNIPPWQTVPLLWLCTRPELLALLRASNLPGPLREAAAAHLARRPPVRTRSVGRTLH
jgi:hypothetical protein